jgi:hypothetical protein
MRHRCQSARNTVGISFSASTIYRLLPVEHEILGTKGEESDKSGRAEADPYLDFLLRYDLVSTNAFTTPSYEPDFPGWMESPCFP